MNIVRLTLVTVFIVTVSCKTVPVRQDDDSVQGWNNHNLIRRMTTAANETEETDQIVGGSKVPSKYKFPYMVGLKFNGNTDIGCGGTLISRQHVLTAAHCFPAGFPKGFKSLTLVMYTTFANVKDKDEDKSRLTQTITKPKQILIHESYSPKTLRNDIALIKLNTPVPVEVTPAILPSANLDIADTWAFASGWGDTTAGGKSSNDLLYTALEVKSDSWCEQRWQKIRPIITSQQICADGGSRHVGHDTCQGDSGGPLVRYDGAGEGMLLGITSFGDRCGSTGGVYTRVSGYLDWINKAKAALQ